MEETRAVEEPTPIVRDACDETPPLPMGCRIRGLPLSSEPRACEGVRHSPRLERPVGVAGMIREFARERSVIGRARRERPGVVVPAARARRRRS